VHFLKPNLWSKSKQTSKRTNKKRKPKKQFSKEKDKKINGQNVVLGHLSVLILLKYELRFKFFYSFHKFSGGLFFVVGLFFSFQGLHPPTYP